ncbi:MAG: hypothetical protein ACK4L4_03665 [Gemmobacter sp.]
MPVCRWVAGLALHGLARSEGADPMPTRLCPGCKTRLRPRGGKVDRAMRGAMLVAPRRRIVADVRATAAALILALAPPVCLPRVRRLEPAT